MLRNLCEQYTNLIEEDIVKLETVAQMLPYFCELSGADIFIDCFMKDQKKGIVAAHGRPSSHSQYKNNIAGAWVLPSNEPIVFFTRDSGVSIRDAKAFTQEDKMVLQKTVPIKNDKGVVIAVLIEETDMTKNMDRAKKLDEMGKTTEQLTETLLDLNGSGSVITNHINAGIVTFDKEQKVAYVNPYGARLYQELGYPATLTGMGFAELCLISGTDAEAAAKGQLEAAEVTMGEKELIVRFQKGADDGGFVMMLEDVSELKKTEKELVEKSVMMREMHHRIKNNLQLISSILSMQGRRSSSEEAKKVLEENVNRINSIASIHEMMIRGSENEVNLKPLLEQLISNMKNYACTEEKRLDIHLKGDDLLVDSDQALAIILITNELITNSIQHGYSAKQPDCEEQQQGTIEVALTAGTVYASVVVRDDGKGFDLEVKRSESLGLDLIRLMVTDKLKGELQIDSGAKGTTVRFDFC